MTDNHVSAIQQMRRRIEALSGLRLSSSARLVAWALLLHTDARGECWPGTATLRRLTGLDARTIRRVRPALGAAFEYAPGGSERGKKRRSSRYRFRLDRGPSDLSTEDVTPSEPGVVCPPKDYQGPSEGPTTDRTASRKRTSIAEVVREITEATAPPWPRRAAL